MTEKIEHIGTFPLGGRSVVRLDERSKQFPARGVLFAEDAPLRSKWWWRPAAFDQGSTSSCVAQSVAGAVVTSPIRFHRDKGIRDQVLAEEYRLQWYRDAQNNDEWPGAEPEYYGTSVLAGVKVAQSRGLIDQYRWCFGLQDVLRTLAYHGPVVVGTWWYSSMNRPEGPRARIGITDDAQRRGGHAYELHSVNKRRKVVAGTNSWGSWGRKGTFEMTWPTLERLLLEDGEAVTLVKTS